MSEAAITKTILAWLRQQPQTWAFKVRGGTGQQAGVPDVLGTCRGRWFALEVKKPGEQPTRLQAWTIEQIQEAGIACVVRSLDEAKAVISQIQEETMTPGEFEKEQGYDEGRCYALKTGLRMSGMDVEPHEREELEEWASTPRGMAAVAFFDAKDAYVREIKEPFFPQVVEVGDGIPF